MFDENKKLILRARLKAARENVDAAAETLRAAKRKNAEAKRKSDLVPLTRLAKRLKKHEEELAQATKRFRIYDYDDYTYDAERVAQTKRHVRPFPERVFVVSSFASTKQWHDWPDEVSHVQYVSAEDGVGNGERRVAAMFGGIVSGPSVNHDVSLSDGSKWEVKQVRDRSDLLRIAASGQRALSEFKQAVDDTVIRLSQFVNASHGLSDASDPRVSYIRCFIAEEFDCIVRYGELTTRRFEQLKKAMHVASSVLRSAEVRVQAMSGYELVHCDDRVAIDDDDARKILATIAESGRATVGHLDVYALLVSKYLCCQAFKDPQRHCEVLAEMLKPSKVLEHLDGLVLVNQRCFRIIKRDELDEVLEPWTISQGRLRYRYKGEVP